MILLISSSVRSLSTFANDTAAWRCIEDESVRSILISSKDISAASCNSFFSSSLNSYALQIRSIKLAGGRFLPVSTADRKAEDTFNLSAISFRSSCLSMRIFLRAIPSLVTSHTSSLLSWSVPLKVHFVNPCRLIFREIFVAELKSNSSPPIKWSPRIEIKQVVPIPEAGKFENEQFSLRTLLPLTSIIIKRTQCLKKCSMSIAEMQCSAYQRASLLCLQGQKAYTIRDIGPSILSSGRETLQVRKL